MQIDESGPGSSIATRKFTLETVKTISIDDFVLAETLEHIDLIKMDIEGSEQDALFGAFDCIAKYRPKLAIAIYHGNDFFELPKILNEKLLQYDFYLGHYTIHAEETILYCLPKELKTPF